MTVSTADPATTTGSTATGSALLGDSRSLHRVVEPKSWCSTDRRRLRVRA
ncbi:hypothetical protein ABZZ16_43555 [Streptomyces sp. NPDC006386]